MPPPLDTRTRRLHARALGYLPAQPSLEAAHAHHGLPSVAHSASYLCNLTPQQYDQQRPLFVAAGLDAGVGWIWGDPRPRDSRTQDERMVAALDAAEAPTQTPNYTQDAR